MGLKDGNGSHKQSNLNVEDAERNGISNSNSTKENTKHDDGVVGSGPQNGENLKKNEDNLPAKEKLYKDGKEDDDLDDSQSSSFGSSLSLKVPSSDDDYPLSSPSSSSTTFSLRKDVLQKHNNIQQGFNKRKNNNNVAFAAVEDREDKASQSKSSISVESETSSLESLTFPVSDLKAVMKSPPPLQLMDKAGAGYDPQRIPSNVFEASVSMATVDWSAASNESLFSLQIGTSFARERIPLGENKHGVSSRISIAETGNRPSVNTEKEKKNKSIKIGKVNEAADENAITKANEEEEDQKEDIAIANNKEDKKQKNKTTLVKWKSTTVPKKPDATGISEDSAGSQVKKENCTCSSSYCSNCSRGCCSNCSCASCNCWNCTQNRWFLCGFCQPPKSVSDGVKVSPKVVSSEQPPLSTSRSWWNCFSCHFCSCSSCKPCTRSFCCPWSYYSYDFSSCCSCKPCSCLSCQSCSCSSCFPCKFSSCSSSSCCSSRLPSNCCCSCNACNFSCSSCCPFRSISCRLCCCPTCPHCSCSRKLWRCSCHHK